MKKFAIWFFILLTSLTITEIKGQEPVASNGKIAIIKGLKLYYEESGNGMPLILLHSFGATCSQWNPYTQELSRHFRVIAVDLPGHGRSDYMDTTNVYLHKKAAAYIIGLIDFLKLDSVNFIGSSSGSFITLYIATIRPNLTKNIILIGGQTYYSQHCRDVITSWGPGFKDQDRINEAIKKHGKERGVIIEKQFWNFRKLYGDPSFTPDILSTITARTLIIHGDNDPIAPVTNAWEMHQNIPKSYLWIVPNGGHLPLLDPANQSDFLRRTIEFLKKDWEKN